MAYSHLLLGAGASPAQPPIRRIGLADLREVLAKGIDAFSGWDPWPIVALKDVPGAVEIIRGGDVIAYLGFNVGLRSWVNGNGDTVEKFLAAVSEADGPFNLPSIEGLTKC